MAKLKFDRSINILARDNESTRVPNDEVWKGTLATRYSGAELEINGTSVAGGSRGDRAIPIFTTLGGGATLRSTVFGFTFTGFAFKVIS